MLDQGFMAQTRSKHGSAGKRGRLCGVATRSQLSLLWWWNGKTCEELKPKPRENWTFVNKKGEAKKHQTEWCDTANKYQRMRAKGVAKT